MSGTYGKIIEQEFLRLRHFPLASSPAPVYMFKIRPLTVRKRKWVYNELV